MNTGKTLFGQDGSQQRLNLDASLYTLPQILSVTLFEKIPSGKPPRAMPTEPPKATRATN